MSVRIAVIADSSACLADAVIERLGIRIVPLHLNIGDEQIIDGAVEPRDLFAKIKAAGSAPRTSAPSPGEFLTSFRAAREEGAESALCLILPSHYSGTYAAAVVAADLAREELAGFPVSVVDTGALAAAHGFAVEAAALALEDGADLEEAWAKAIQVGTESVLIGAIDSVGYLARSGRLPWLVGWAADLVGIKPVISFAEGRPRMVGRARTMERAIGTVARLAAEGLRASGMPEVVILHAAAGERAAVLAETIKRYIPIGVLTITEVNSVMAAHTGPGFIALAGHPVG